MQELAATSFAAEAAADAANRRGDADSAVQLRDVAGAVRGNIRVLRSLLVDIYPESLRTAGLGHALDDLAATARARGLEVDVEVLTRTDALSEEHERLIYRVAQETLRNAVAHSGARHVGITIAPDGGATVLEVLDDGIGFDPARLAAPGSDGHIGTAVLQDLAVQAGAELSLRTAPGAGTAWRLRLPGA